MVVYLKGPLSIKEIKLEKWKTDSYNRNWGVIIPGEILEDFDIMRIEERSD